MVIWFCICYEAGPRCSEDELDHKVCRGTEERQVGVTGPQTNTTDLSAFP